MVDRSLEPISAPYACAALASTCVNPPLPPLWNDQAPRFPSCSPMAIIKNTSPEPADIGPTLVPVVALAARWALMISDSK